MARCLSLLALLLGVIAAQAIRPGDELTGVSDTAKSGASGPKSINPSANHPAEKDGTKDADEALAVFSDLGAIFKDDNSKDMETAFKQFGDSLKQIGDQIKAGIKKLSNDSSFPKMDLEKLKDWGLTQVKVVADKAQTIDVTKTANAAIGDTATKTKETTKTVKDKATEAANSIKAARSNKAAKRMKAIGAGKTEEEQLIEQLRAIQANRAARYRGVRDQSSSDTDSEDKPFGQVFEQLQEIKQSVDPEHTQKAFEEIKKGVNSLVSKFDTMINSIKDNVEQSSSERQTAGRTTRGVDLSAENVTHVIENAFRTKDMKKAFKDLGKSFADIIHKMKYNLDDVDKGIQNMMAKHRKTTGNKSAVPLPKRSSQEANASNKESDDLKALKDALEKFKSATNVDKIKAEFAKIEETMKQIELEIKDEVKQLHTLIAKASKDSSIVAPPGTNPENNAVAGEEQDRDIEEPIMKGNTISEREFEEDPNSKAVGGKEIGDKLEKLYADITPEAVRKVFNDLIDDLRSLGDVIDTGFDALEPQDTNGLSETQRALLHKIKRAIAKTKAHAERDVQPWRRQEQDVSNEGNTLDCLMDKLRDIQKSVDVTNLYGAFPQISKDVQCLNMELEEALAKIKNKLKANGEKDILRRTITEKEDMVDQLEGAFDAKKINQKFTEFCALLQNAIEKLKTEMAQTSNNVEGKMKEKAMKRSSVPNNSKDIEVDPEVIKIVAEIKDTFDPENIRKAFNSLHGEFMKVGDKLGKGLQKFEQSVEASSKKAHPVVREVPMGYIEDPSMDNVVSEVKTVLIDNKPEDCQKAIQDAVNKLKELANIFKFGTNEIGTDLQKERASLSRKRDIAEAFDEIIILLKNESRTRRDTKQQAEQAEQGYDTLQESVEHIGDTAEATMPDKFNTAFRWLEDNVERIKQVFIAKLDKLTKQEAHEQQRRDTNVDTTITEEIKQTFDKDKITKAFEEVLDAFKIAKDTFDNGIKSATRDVFRLSKHLDYVKRVLSSDKHNKGAEEIHNGIMKALAKIRSTFSRESLAKSFQKLDAEVNTLETEANEAIKNMESWLLVKMDQDDQQHSPQAGKSDAMKRGLTGSTNLFDPETMDIDHAVNTMNPEKLEKVNGLVELILDEGQQIVSEMKIFGGELKLPLPPAPTLPPLPPIKPINPMEPIEPMTPTKPLTPIEPMQPLRVNV